MRKVLQIGSVLLLVAASVAAQEILFDQMVEAGGLKCYPLRGDPTSWHCLPALEDDQ